MVLARVNGLESLSLGRRFPANLTYLGRGVVLGLPIPVWTMLSLMVVLQWLLNRTTYGRWVFTVGANESAAWLSGVPVGAVRAATHMLSGMMCALAGFLYSCRMGVAVSGAGYDMDIITGLTIGGVSMDGGAGTVVAAVVGVGLMAFIRNGLVLLKIGALWHEMLTGTLTIFSLVLDRMRRIGE